MNLNYLYFYLKVNNQGTKTGSNDSEYILLRISKKSHLRVDKRYNTQTYLSPVHYTEEGEHVYFDEYGNIIPENEEKLTELQKRAKNAYKRHIQPIRNEINKDIKKVDSIFDKIGQGDSNNSEIEEVSKLCNKLKEILTKTKNKYKLLARISSTILARISSTIILQNTKPEEAEPEISITEVQTTETEEKPIPIETISKILTDESSCLLAKLNNCIKNQEIDQVMIHLQELSEINFILKDSAIEKKCKDAEQFIEKTFKKYNFEEIKKIFEEYEPNFLSKQTYIDLIKAAINGDHEQSEIPEIMAYLYKYSISFITTIESYDLSEICKIPGLNEKLSGLNNDLLTLLYYKDKYDAFSKMVASNYKKNDQKDSLIAILFLDKNNKKGSKAKYITELLKIIDVNQCRKLSKKTLQLKLDQKIKLGPSINAFCKLDTGHLEISARFKNYTAYKAILQKSDLLSIIMCLPILTNEVSYLNSGSYAYKALAFAGGEVSANASISNSINCMQPWVRFPSKCHIVFYPPKGNKAPKEILHAIKLALKRIDEILSNDDQQINKERLKTDFTKLHENYKSAMLDERKNIEIAFHSLIYYYSIMLNLIGTDYVTEKTIKDIEVNNNLSDTSKRLLAIMQKDSLKKQNKPYAILDYSSMIFANQGIPVFTNQTNYILLSLSNNDSKRFIYISCPEHFRMESLTENLKDHISETTTAKIFHIHDVNKATINEIKNKLEQFEIKTQTEETKLEHGVLKDGELYETTMKLEEFSHYCIDLITTLYIKYKPITPQNKIVEYIEDFFDALDNIAIEKLQETLQKAPISLILMKAKNEIVEKLKNIIKKIITYSGLIEYGYKPETNNQELYKNLKCLHILLLNGFSVFKPTNIISNNKGALVKWYFYTFLSQLYPVKDDKNISQKIGPAYIRLSSNSKGLGDSTKGITVEKLCDLAKMLFCTKLNTEQQKNILEIKPDDIGYPFSDCGFHLMFLDVSFYVPNRFSGDMIRTIDQDIDRVSKMPSKTTKTNNFSLEEVQEFLMITSH